MADQRPWLKLWKSAYTDPGLERLTAHELRCWLRLLLFVGIHGDGGIVILQDGYRSLLSCFSVASLTLVRRALSRLPGVLVTELAHPAGAVMITFTKWPKYQEDNSAERVRRFRHKRRYSNADSPLPVTEPERYKPPIGNGSRSRSRRDTPLPPAGSVEPSVHKPATLPAYPEPDAETVRKGLESVREVLNRVPDAPPF